MIQVFNFGGNNSAKLQIRIINLPICFKGQCAQKPYGYVRRRHMFERDIARHCIRLDINNDAVRKGSIYLLLFLELPTRWWVRLDLIQKRNRLR